MSKKITAFLAFLAVIISAPLSAASMSAQLSVSVQVVARTILTVDTQPSTVQITSEDIARGYIDVPQSVAFRVRSNAANGYNVQFEPIGYPFRSAQVNWGTTMATVGSDGAWITRSYQQGTTAGSLSVRLNLAATTAPGSYPWPVRFTADSM